MIGRKVSLAGVRRGWFWVLRTTLNRAVIRAARRGHGPFALIRHTGRKTGRPYETPMLLIPHGDGFIAELTYGPRVAWLRNVVAAGGHCTVLREGVTYRIDAVRPCDPEVGRRAFGFPAALVLRLARRRDFRLLHVATPPAGGGAEIDRAAG
ncbi:nitroreductase/quinone reductase family protein [Actinoplanes sp. ATCC 53533]|uniref:nitroreductase/quinone reductase family protein n=1 Tax=Actinoplanes sp. ATCC 53533 TaxID=1288362 RepID=UPI001F43F46E|nr:nitroreductase/quinone reductase family protein [Actinoplanes sp. ATCC 53533]